MPDLAKGTFRRAWVARTAQPMDDADRVNGRLRPW